MGMSDLDAAYMRERHIPCAKASCPPPRERFGFKQKEVDHCQESGTLVLGVHASCRSGMSGTVLDCQGHLSIQLDMGDNLS
jgi:hypothetical protein